MCRCAGAEEYGRGQGGQGAPCPRAAPVARPPHCHPRCPSAPAQAYGRELDEAYEWCLKYKQSRKEAELHQAWDLYYHVFKRINKQLPSLTTLELQYVAPALVRAQVRGGRSDECDGEVLHGLVLAATGWLPLRSPCPPAPRPHPTPRRRAWSWRCRARALRGSRW